MQSPDVARAAAANGFSHIGVRVLPATPTERRYPLAPGSPLLRETKQVLGDLGVRVLDIEALNLNGSITRGEWLPQLEVGAELGATVLNVIGSDPDRPRLTAAFAQLAADAEDLGIVASLEPISYQPLDRLESAQAIITDAGRGGIMLDVLHFTRAGHLPDDIGRIDPSLITVVQLCDGPTRVPVMRPVDRADVPMNQSVEGSDREQESRLKRLIPGQGQFRIDEILQRLPASVPLSVEVPDPVQVKRVGTNDWVARLAAAGMAVDQHRTEVRKV